MCRRLREQARSHRRTRLGAEVCATRDRTVGASLLAMAVCQATSMLAMTASSRAGSLPQGSGV
ncbi:hypothetical protein C0J56_06175 [Pseudomonas fluorescens]|nr:hypothetical protein C0J56_06175 [Pseudomonas fluorescens]